MKREKVSQKDEIFKILNLYACLGGNRYKWDEVAKAAGIKIQVTAVENDPELAKLYQERFPDDIVIVADAHHFLLDHFKEFDFIWSSPPCPTHGKIRLAQKNHNKFIPLYPDMKLYEEIIFLDNLFEGKYVVENVVPYYEPLITAHKRGRHLYWTNFKLPSDLRERKESQGFMNSNVKDEVTKWSEFHDYDFKKYKGNQRTDKIARNLVDYEAGKTIFECVLNIKTKSNLIIEDLFNYENK